MIDVGFFESFFEDININSWFNLINIVINFLKYEGNVYGGIILLWFCLYGNVFKGVV